MKSPPRMSKAPPFIMSGVTMLIAPGAENEPPIAFIANEFAIVAILIFASDD